MMKAIKFYIYFGTIFLFYSCYENKPENTDKRKDLNKPREVKQETDTSTVGILVMKKNKTSKEETLMLKNAAFCSCIGIEENKIQQENNNKYVLIPDNSYAGYMTYSTLGAESF